MSIDKIQYEIDIVKAQAIAKYLNRIINEENYGSKGDYTQQIQDDILENYTNKMAMANFAFHTDGFFAIQLESVRKICGIGKNYPILNQNQICVYEDHIIKKDSRDITAKEDDIIYGTPEYIKEKYSEIMNKITELQGLQGISAFNRNYEDMHRLNDIKRKYRRYIQENNITGIDISIPETELDHEKTEKIANTLIEMYGSNCKDKENIKQRILVKLEEHWNEIVNESQSFEVSEFLEEEFKDMGCKENEITAAVFVKDNFIYLRDLNMKKRKVIYATLDTLKENYKALNRTKKWFDSAGYLVFALEIERKNINEDIEELLRYVKENQISTTDLENEELDNSEPEINVITIPTKRKKIELNDSIPKIINKMSEDNHGALTAIMALMQEDALTSSMLLLGLDDMNIRGSQIWIAYKDLYREDAKKFAEAIKNKDTEMIDFINEEYAALGEEEKAVREGASIYRNITPKEFMFTEKEREELKARREKRRSKRDDGEQADTKDRKSIKELDRELEDLKDKEAQAKELASKYEEQLPDKPNQDM